MLIYTGYSSNAAVNLRGFFPSVNPRFEGGIPDFIIHFNGVHGKVPWRNPKLKSLNSMPAMFSWLCSFSVDL